METSSDSASVIFSQGAATPGQPQGVRARYFNMYRLAAYRFALHTRGHTLGAVIATSEFGAKSNRAVSMINPLAKRRRFSASG